MNDSQTSTPSKKRLWEFVRSLLVVVPLTLLIWIYAEREQLATDEGVTLAIDVRIGDGQKSLSLQTPPPENRTLSVTLRGPRAELDAFRNKFDVRSGKRIMLEIPGNTPPEQSYQFLATALLANSPDLGGLTPVRAQPETLTVYVDKLERRVLEIRVPDELKGRLNSVSFQPPTVEVQAPAAVFAKAAAAGELYLTAQLAGLDAVRTPGPKSLESVTLARPSSLLNNSVVVSTITAKATFTTTDTNKALEIRVMSIFLLTEQKLLDEYKITLPSPTLSNVKVSGPPEKLALIERPDGIQPRALLELTRPDVTNPQPKRLRFVDLPEGVVVSIEDQNRLIEYKVEKRATPE